MATLRFTPNIQRHVRCPDMTTPGVTLREVLENAFRTNPQARAYVLDDQSSLRKHMTIFIDGHALRDRRRLSDPVGENSVVCVFQALSGG